MKKKRVDFCQIAKWKSPISVYSEGCFCRKIEESVGLEALQYIQRCGKGRLACMHAHEEHILSTVPSMIIRIADLSVRLAEVLITGLCLS